MRLFVAIGGLAVSVMGGTAAYATADLSGLDAAKAELSGIFADSEQNLIEAEAIEMNEKDLIPKKDSIVARQQEYQQRIDSHNAYCQGTFEEPEYSRRLAYCNAEESEIQTLLSQLELERQDVLEQFERLEQRNADQQERGQQIEARLTPALTHFVVACQLLPLDDQLAYCHMPPAAGPRTAPIVAQMEAELSSMLQPQ